MKRQSTSLQALQDCFRFFYEDIIEPVCRIFDDLVEVLDFCKSIIVTIAQLAFTVIAFNCNRLIYWLTISPSNNNILVVAFNSVAFTIISSIRRFLFSVGATVEDQDPRSIPALSLHRPVNQSIVHHFTLDNGMNVGYELKLSVNAVDLNSVSLFIVSAHDVLMGFNSSCILSSSDGYFDNDDDDKSENIAILYLSQSEYSDYSPRTSSSQLIRIHLASVYNFTQILMDFGFSHINIKQDYHGYSRIFSTADSIIDNRIMLEYQCPMDIVRITDGLSISRSDCEQSLSSKIKCAIRNSLLEINLSFISLVIRKYSLVQLYQIICHPNARFLLDSTRMIELQLANRPFERLLTEINSILSASNSGNQVITPSPLTAEYARPPEIEAITKKPMENIRISTDTLEKSRGRLFNIGSFTSWLRSQEQEEAEEEESALDRNIIENSEESKQLFSIPSSSTAKPQ